jgi:hypothetical protein
MTTNKQNEQAWARFHRGRGPRPDDCFLIQFSTPEIIGKTICCPRCYGSAAPVIGITGDPVYAHVSTPLPPIKNKDKHLTLPPKFRELVDFAAFAQKHRLTPSTLAELILLVERRKKLAVDANRAAHYGDHAHAARLSTDEDILVDLIQELAEKMELTIDLASSEHTTVTDPRTGTVDYLPKVKL